MTCEEERVFIALAQQVEVNGKPTRRAWEAQGVLLAAWSGWIHKLTKPYVRRGMESADAWQWGAMGFLHAVNKFDLKRNFRLSTYAIHWVKMYIRNAARKSSMIALTTTQADRAFFWQIGRVEAAVHARGGSACDVVWALAKHAPPGVRDSEAAARGFVTKLAMARHPLPLDARIPGHDESYLTLLPSREALAPDLLEAQERLSLLHCALTKVAETATRRELFILKRILSEYGEKKTLGAIGAEFGVSRERIRQIEVALIVRLRREYRRCEGDV